MTRKILLLTAATSLLEIVVAVLIYLWIGWPGLVVYGIGAVLIGCDRALIDDVRARAVEPQRGEHVARPARCASRYRAHVGSVGGCGWEGHVVREIGSDEIPPCPRCGSWTEPR